MRHGGQAPPLQGIETWQLNLAQPPDALLGLCAAASCTHLRPHSLHPHCMLACLPHAAIV